MKKMKLFLSSGLVVLCLVSIPINVMAGSPEFAYSSEKWASLRDDKLEYTEIADLVHEYNNTVIQNQIEYKDYKDKSSDDIAQDYYDAADDADANANYPDSSDENYASGLSSYLKTQNQVDQLREQGDDNVEDGDIKKLGYDKTEAGLVQQAQEQMITYWSQTYKLDTLNEQKEQAKTAYDVTTTRLQAGMATQADVLYAKEKVTSTEASLLSAQSNLKKTKESLCLMLGWTYGADVDIEEVPEPDMESISNIDLDTDVKSGVANNYSLKILEKQIANAKSESNKESLQENYNSQKENVATNIQNAYHDLILAKSDYDSALQSYEIEKGNMDTANRKIQAGTMTQNDYKNKQSSYESAEVNVHTQKLALLNAQVKYQWAVNGLASTGM